MVNLAALSDERLKAAHASLDRNGFALCKDVFTIAQVNVVEQILDGLLHDLQSDAPAKNGRFARDMAPAVEIGTNFEAQNAAKADWDQPEIQYAGCLRPELLNTELFCYAMTLRLLCVAAPLAPLTMPFTSLRTRL